MVRQYRIHTDIDGSNNKTYDMTNGLIRFYEPNDLGLSISNNVWQSQGIGISGNSSISHPSLEFKFETFGNSLEENYRIFNEFIRTILESKYVTLEYTNAIGTYYADIKLETITKTEGYGFNGTFSEKISFSPITMWYVYEQLKFSKVQNGEIGINTKIHTDQNSNISLPDDDNDEFGDGNNLLPNSTWNLGNGTWTFNVGTGSSFEIQQPDNDKPRSNILHALPTATGTQQISNIPHPIHVSTDDVLTISFDFKENQIPSKDSTLFALRVFPDATIANSQANAVWYENISHSSVVPNWNTNPVTEWKRFTYTFTVTADGWLDPVIYGSDTGGTHESWYREIKIKDGDTATAWTPNKQDVLKSRYTYDYSYYGEDDVERFSKWKIDDGIFSFTARMIPSAIPTTPPDQTGRTDYGVRFLDEQFNEYTAVLFGDKIKPDSIQFNTDVNDEYYLAQVGMSTMNIFSALNYQRFRTRFIQKGIMELVNVDMVEMNVKRKIEFV
ncbi:phage distal tail protein domain-containing protein [Lactococcus garvieae]|uniref:phage distal tail protein domain-containing protein n=1 Tax=Lactococcus garvieae TaxID=1363 RepID=UPI0037CC17EE